MVEFGAKSNDTLYQSLHLHPFHMIDRCWGHWAVLYRTNVVVHANVDGRGDTAQQAGAVLARGDFAGLTGSSLLHLTVLIKIS